MPMIVRLSLIVVAFLSLPVFADEEKQSIAVLNFAAEESEQATADLIHAKLVNILSRDTRFTTVDMNDVTRSIDIAAQKTLFQNCDTSTCLSELAEAFGADLMVYGTFGKVGSQSVLSMQLYDSKTSTSVARVDRDVEDAAAFLKDLEGLAGELLAVKFENLNRSSPSPLFWTGGIMMAIGFGVGLVSGGFAIADELVLSDRSSIGAEKAQAEERALILEIVATAGLIVGVAGVGIMALGDFE